MSNSNEFENVIVLKFDNSDFEKNARKSSKTLEKLDESMKKTSSSKGLKRLFDSANRLDLSGLSKSIDTVNKRFSTMGIVGATAIAKISNSLLNKGWSALTAVPRQILSGGRQRALDIQQARFQLQGLFQDAKDAEKMINQVMADADYAVTGTAYGLNEAAKAASQLAASGIKPGRQMKDVLKSITGLAAMTNSQFSDMSQIFTTIAGNGRIMGKELIQISSRGINAAQAITKYLNANDDARRQVEQNMAAAGRNKKALAAIAEQARWTEADIREMVSSGVIDFMTFSNAMNYAFGDQAKRANETYTGSLANMKAALSRIGQGPMEAHLQNMTKIFNALRLVINGVNNATKPLQYGIMRIGRAGTNILVSGINKVSSLLEPLGKNADKWSKKMNKFLYGNQEQSKSAVSNNKKITDSLNAISKASKGASEAARNSYKSFASMNRGLSFLKGLHSIAGNVVSALSKIAKITLTVFGGVAKGLAPLGNIIIYGLNKVVDFTLFIGNKTNKVLDAFTSKLDGFVVPAASRFAAKLQECIGKSILFIQQNDKLHRLSVALSGVFGRIAATATQLWHTTLSKIRLSASSGRLKKFKDSLEDIYDVLKNIGGRALDKVINGFEALNKKTGAFKVPSFDEFMTGLGEFGKKVGSNGKSLLTSLFGVDEVYGAEDESQMAKANKDMDNASESTHRMSDAMKSLPSKMDSRISLLERQNSAWHSYATMVVDLAKSIGQWLSAVKDGLANAKVTTYFFDFLDSIGKSFGTQGINDVVNNTTKIGKLIVSFKLLKSLSAALEGFATMTAATAKTLLSVSASIDKLTKVYAKRMKYENLKIVATALLMFVASIAVLGYMPTDTLIKGITSMALVVVATFALLKLLDKMSKNTKVNMVNIYKTVLAIAALGGSMLLLSFSAKIFASMSGDDLLKAGVSIGGFLAMVAAFTKYSKSVYGTSKMFSSLGTAMLTMSLSLLILKFIDWDTYGESMAKLAGIIAMLIAASRMAKASHGNMKTLVGLGIAASMLTVPLIALSLVPWTSLTKAVIALGVVIFSLAGAAKLADGVKGSLKNLVVLGAVVGTVATSLFVLAILPVDKLLPAALALGGVVLAISVAGFIANGAISGCLALGVLFGVLAVAFYVINKFDFSNAINSLDKIFSISIKMAALGIALAALTPISSIAMVGALAFGLFITELTVVLVALGGISKIPGVMSLVSSGGKLLQKIGEALGRFVGGIVKGVSKAMVEDASTTIIAIGGFAVALKKLITQLKTIKNEKLTSPMSKIASSLKGIVKAVKELSGDKFDDGKLTQFAKNMHGIMNAFKGFAEETEGVKNIDMAIRVAKAIKQLADASDKTTSYGGIEALAYGTQHLTRFAKDVNGMMKALGGSDGAFANATMTEEQFNNMANVAKSMMAMAKIVSKLDGMEVKYSVTTGKTRIKPLEYFATDCKSAIPKFKEFAETTLLLDQADSNFAERTQKLAGALNALIGVVSQISSSRGIQYQKGWFQPLTNFASDAKVAIPFFKEFIDASAEIAPENISAVTSFADAIKAVSKIKIPKSGLFNGFFGGKKSFAGFGRDLKNFAKSINKINAPLLLENTNAIVSSITAITNATSGIPDNAEIYNSGANFVTQYTAGINAEAEKGEPHKSGSNVGKKAHKGLKSRLFGFFTSGNTASSYFASALSVAVGVNPAGSALAGSGLSGAASRLWEFNSKGRDAATGYKNGLSASDILAGVFNAGATMARRALAGVASAKGQHSRSPAKKFAKLGKDGADGYILGFDRKTSAVYDAGVKIAKTAMSAAKDAFSAEIPDIVTPEIKPIINLDEVVNGIDKIADMMNNSYDITPNTSINQARVSRPEIYREWNPGENQNGDSSTTFIQNNYSPKSLSRLEIYRQTKNLVNTIKNNS